ncbi:MAG: hypothetical protein ABSB37_17685 [Xanthobacteraceae bacterium]
MQRRVICSLITSRAIFSLPWRCSPGALVGITEPSDAFRQQIGWLNAAVNLAIKVGVNAFQSNVPPHLVQRRLGHPSLRTTSIYGDVMGPEERAFAMRMWARGKRSRP